MNSLTIKGVIVEGLSIQTDNSQLKPTNPISQIKKHANQLMPIGKAQRNGLANLIKLGLMGVSLLTLPLSGYAAISATTSQTILGTEPYFVLIDGTTRTPLTSTNELLSFGYIDKDGDAKTADVSMKDTLIVVNANMTHDQLVTRVTRDGSAYSLNGVLSATGSTVGIDDDDGDDTSVTAYGSYSAKLTKDGVLVPATDINKFDPCSLYKLELKTIKDATLGKVRAATTYGSPWYKDYTASTVTYTLEPDVIVPPYTCFAQPGNQAVQASGTAAEWDSTRKAFLPIHTAAHPTTNTTTKNFPTMGFHGAEFKLTVAGTTAKQMIESTALASSITTTGTVTTGTYTPPGSAISLELSAASTTTKVLKVVLKGPNMTTLPTAAHTATAFTLKSGATTVYSFTLAKWFIARYGVLSSWSTSAYTNVFPASTYCSPELIGGGKYKIPSVWDYTNAVLIGGGIGSGGYGGNYKRAISGGLFAEWANPSRMASTYPNSDFETTIYWASEAGVGTNQYRVYSHTGYPSESDPAYIQGRAACVSP